MRTRVPCLPHLIRSAAPTAELVPDRTLLAEFVSTRSGIAFELLVRRHGPAVWAVCRRHLANSHDAEDAFQATFLVLAKAARRISKSHSVGSWLYGVAYRVALKARRTAARRKRVETAVTPADEPAVLPVHPAGDVTAIVHAELERLPDRYRLPLLLCDLEGLSRKEASAQLGWPEGTLSGRLNRARKLLAGRLTGRGIAAGVLVGVATFALPSYAVAAAVGVGRSVFDTTIPAAPATVAALARGAMRDMTRSFVTKLTAGVLAAGVLLGGGLLGLRFDPPAAQAAPVPKEPEKAKPEDVTDAHAQLLALAPVQRELKLTAEQRVKLMDGFDKLDEELEKANAKLFGGGEPGGVGQAGGQQVPFANSPALDAPFQQYQKGCRELAASVLTKGQLVRLQQVEVQVLGPYALKLKRVADELKLTDEQKKAVDEALQQGVGNGVGVPGVAPGGGPVVPQAVPLPAPAPVGPGGFGPGVPASGTEPARTADDALADIVKGLTAAQTKAWKELTGDKVGFDKPRVLNRCPALFNSMFPTQEGATDSGPGVPQATPPVAPGGAFIPPANVTVPAQAVPLPAPAPTQPAPPPGNPGK